jgi:RND family efflux transporter MFP subunit
MKTGCKMPRKFTTVIILFNAIVQVGWSTGGIPAITTPSADVTLSFLQPGQIDIIQAKEGQLVKKGDLILSQYDLAEQAQLAQIEAESQDVTKIKAAEATLAQKKMDLKKLEWASSRGAATELEVEHSKLDVTIAEFSLGLATLEHEQALRKYEEAKIRVENMRLRSPVDGYVEKLQVEKGESVQSLEGVVRIVKTDPLWIDVPVPLAVANGLSIHANALVIFPDPNAMELSGKVVFIAHAADAASNTLRVKVEVSNEVGRPSGEHILVSFSGKEEK